MGTFLSLSTPNKLPGAVIVMKCSISVSQVQHLEKTNKSITKELSDLKSDVDTQQAKIRQQTKELKDAVAARKLAMDEFTELNEKVRRLS